jgi:DNA-directed RNA polymerase specialized sigma24 family protein
VTAGLRDDRPRRTLSADEFERLLQALDPDRTRAGEAYERLRAKLQVFFSSRRCPSATELVDATLDRVARKLVELPGGEIREITAFVLGVARFVLLEDQRDPARHAVPFAAVVAHPPQPEPDRSTRLEAEDQALSACLEELAPEARALIRDYYQGERRAKIDARRALAARLGITMTALTMRAFHLRRRLESCVSRRLDPSVTVSG